MSQKFCKYAGVVQTVIGALGAAIPNFESLLGAQTGGNIFNIVSGVVLGALGFKGSANAQRAGATAIGGLNGLVGLLGAFGANNVAGLQLGNGAVSVIINFAIAAWGLYSGLAKKKK